MSVPERNERLRWLLHVLLTPNGMSEVTPWVLADENGTRYGMMTAEQALAENQRLADQNAPGGRWEPRIDS